MKKSVLIVIGLVYIASILIIGFFGMRQVVYSNIIYVGEIECINEEARDMSEYKLIIVDYIEGNTGVQLSYRVTPDDATNKDVRFIYDENQTVATVTDLGTVVFNSPGLIVVRIASTDGTIASETVWIVAINS